VKGQMKQEIKDEAKQINHKDYEHLFSKEAEGLVADELPDKV